MDLLIDDQRTLDVDIIARTVKAGFNCLRKFRFAKLYLDYDLGDEKGHTGEQILIGAIWMNYLPNTVQLVTQNPVGRERMANILKDNNYAQKTGCLFEKKQKKENFS